MAVYLIHFSEPLHHARHYVGYTDNVRRRIAEHRRGEGSPLVRAVNEAGIAWVVARLWIRGDRELERRIKAWHGSAVFCPMCNKMVKVEQLDPRPLELQRWFVPRQAIVKGKYLAFGRKEDETVAVVSN